LITNHSLVSQKGVKQKSILTAALSCSLLPHKHLNTIQEACKGRRNCKNIEYCSAEIKMVYYKWFMFCTVNQMFVINIGVSFSVSIPCNPLVIFYLTYKIFARCKPEKETSCSHDMNVKG
jgi:hypothetical protein